MHRSFPRLRGSGCLRGPWRLFLNIPSYWRHRVIDLKLKTPERVTFESTLRKRIVGQDDAVEQVSEMYERVMAGMIDEHKPLCNMIFLGPTGVGKTLLVQAVAEAIHEDMDALTVINCAEYSEDHQIARIIGAPPGYIGHDTRSEE